MSGRRIGRLFLAFLALAVILTVGAFLGARFLTRGAVAVPVHEASVEHGAYLFAAAGCAACHTGEEEGAPTGAGGPPLATPFGTFHGPNITPSREHGIGGWSDADFIQALSQGVGPGGADLYPVFPYPSFTRMTAEDMLDIKAYLFTLPAVEEPSRPHEVGLPFSFRPVLAFWKLLNFTPGPDPAADGEDDAWRRGRYIARALAHCGECHTPRDAMGAALEDMAFAGNADGPDGMEVPNITPDAATGIGGWQRSDLDFFLQSGMLPNGDFAGSGMATVVREGTSRLTADDRSALIDYLTSVSPIENQIGDPEGDGGGGEIWD